MRGYWGKLKNMFLNDYTSLIYFIMGLLMFGASAVQLDDITGKADPALDHPYTTVWLCTILGAFTMFISPLRTWFIVRNAIMGFSFFLSIYLILDAWENIMKGANGVWFFALMIYTFLFARSYRDLLKDKERYCNLEHKTRKEDKY